MIIALDYDGTYTEDPNFWNEVIRAAKIHGHHVVVATMRFPEPNPEATEVLKIFSGKVDDIIFTSRKAKMAFLLEIGINPDIWIDDNPLWLFNNG